MTGRQVTYALAFAIEIVGMLLVFWIGIPLFRHMIKFEGGASAGDEVALLVGAILILISYWQYLRHDPPFELPRSAFAGHVFLFLNRLIFIFASGIFSFAVYRYSDQLDLTALKAVLLMIVLFAIFCFSRHLERIGLLFLNGYRPALHKSV
jgi:hypothetical protein